MFTPRRNVTLAVLLFLTIFIFWPRNTNSLIPSPTGSDGTSKEQNTKGSVEQPLVDRKADVSSHKPQQLTLAKLQSMPLRDQLAYHFPYNVAGKFPAYIWQTWKTTPGDGKFPEKFRSPEASWTVMHPNFVHQVITDLGAVPLIKHFYGAIPDVIEAYNSLPLPILKADFFRYLILLARGGVYADIDTQVLKPAVDWLPAAFRPNTVGLVIGIEADPDRPDWKDWYSRRIQFCQWTIQSKPGHPVLREIVANITETTLERKKAGKLTMNHDVVEFTGPAVWTDVIMEHFNNPVYFDHKVGKGGKGENVQIGWQDFTHMEEPKLVGDVVVLPITSFSPGVKHSGSKGIDDPIAFVFHAFDGSWKPENERHIEPKDDRLKREREARERAALEAKNKSGK